MLLLTGLFLLTAAALQIFVGLRPLFAVRKAVSALRQGQIKQINIKGPAEVRPLILEINSLMADNSAAVERARARASDLAHGMKTPLTILAQIGEALAGQKNKQHARQIGDQVSIIASRVDRQLALARTGTAASVTGIQMNEALQKLLKAATPLAHHAGKEISYEPHDAFFIRTDMTDFLEASGNVMDNAIRHSYKTIQMSAADLGKFVRVTIEDDGPGIAEADRTRVFERGIRLDESEGGSGLGFAISADILRAYDGTVSLARSKLGGLAVHMDWPKAILRGKTDYERQK
jgi:signal transduction histidine kinase